jgi:hypothetical protein
MAEIKIVITIMRTIYPAYLLSVTEISESKRREHSILKYLKVKEENTIY